MLKRITRRPLRPESCPLTGVHQDWRNFLLLYLGILNGLELFAFDGIRLHWDLIRFLALQKFFSPHGPNEFATWRWWLAIFALFLFVSLTHRFLRFRISAKESLRFYLLWSLAMLPTAWLGLIAIKFCRWKLSREFLAASQPIFFLLGIGSWKVNDSIILRGPYWLCRSWAPRHNLYLGLGLRGNSPKMTSVRSKIIWRFRRWGEVNVRALVLRLIWTAAGRLSEQTAGRVISMCSTILPFHLRS